MWIPISPKIFSAEEMKINDDANKKDSIYWESTRPIALTDEEIKDYHRKDSIVKKTSTRIYKDLLIKKTIVSRSGISFFPVIIIQILLKNII